MTMTSIYSDIFQNRQNSSCGGDGSVGLLQHLPVSCQCLYLWESRIFSASPKAFHSAYWVPRCRNFRARLAKENGTWQRQDLCTELDVQQQVVAPRNKWQQREAKIGGYDKHRDNHSICFRAAGLRLVDHTSQEPTDAALNTDVSAASALFLTRWPCMRWKV